MLYPNVQLYHNHSWHSYMPLVISKSFYLVFFSMENLWRLTVLFFLFSVVRLLCIRSKVWQGWNPKLWTKTHCYIHFFLKLLWVSTRLGWIFWKVDSPSVGDDNIASMVKQKKTSCTALKLTNVYKCDQPNHPQRVFFGKRTPWTWWLPCTPLPKFKLEPCKRSTPCEFLHPDSRKVWLEFQSSYRKNSNTGWCLNIFIKMGIVPKFSGWKLKEHVKPPPIEYHEISTCILKSTPFHQWYSSCKCLAIWVLVATGLHRYRQRWDCRRNPDPTCHV